MFPNHPRQAFHVGEVPIEKVCELGLLLAFAKINIYGKPEGEMIPIIVHEDY